ncbi:MAG: hypothetical protein WC325_01265 [Candidatus Bathyarchaeia archaeon]|jgi:hypothetical protein
MAKGSNKQTSSLAFSLQKTYERILNYKPSLPLLGLIVVGISLFFISGGVYDLLTSDVPVIYFTSTGSILVYYPSLSDQFIIESILVMIFAGLGVAGFLASYQSTKYAYNPRLGYRLLLIGCALLIVAVILIENGMLAKLGV